MTSVPSSFEHLSVVITAETANDVTQTTADNVVTSSSSRGMGFYFQCAVVVIGVVGTAANALILYALVASKQHTKHVLIFHQNVLDFISSLLLIITFSLNLCNTYLRGFGVYWFCVLIQTEYLNWVVILAAKVNLIFVSIERYLKVVYPIWSTKLRNWMIYSAMALAWISGFVHMTTTAFLTSDFINGVCYPYAFWNSPASFIANGIFYFLYFYVIIFIVFIFCYWRILAAIRRQARVMAGHNAAGSSIPQTHSNQIQTNVIKTMVLVSASFLICDLPLNVYYLLRSFQFTPANYVAYYISLFISYVYICTNPFIYATKFDPVKRILLSLIPCKKTQVQPIESVELAMGRTAAKGSSQLRK